MVTCPNCGQETEGDYCQWCHYPILSRGLMSRRKAEKQARKEAERLAKEQAKREAEEARKAKEAEETARKEAEEGKEAVQDIGSEIYEGDVELVVPSPVGFEQVRQFKERLEQVENLRVLWSGGSVDEGSIIAISVQKPMTLIRILNEMPTLEKVDKKGEKKIVVMLKTPTAS